MSSHPETAPPMSPCASAAQGPRTLSAMPQGPRTAGPHCARTDSSRRRHVQCPLQRPGHSARACVSRPRASAPRHPAAGTAPAIVARRCPRPSPLRARCSSSLPASPLRRPIRPRPITKSIRLIVETSLSSSRARPGYSPRPSGRSPPALRRAWQLAVAGGEHLVLLAECDALEIGALALGDPARVDQSAVEVHVGPAHLLVAVGAGPTGGTAHRGHPRPAGASALLRACSAGR